MSDLQSRIGCKYTVHCSPLKAVTVGLGIIYLLAYRLQVEFVKSDRQNLLSSGVQAMTIAGWHSNEFTKVEQNAE